MICKKLKVNYARSRCIETLLFIPLKREVIGAMSSWEIFNEKNKSNYCYFI